MTPSSAAAWDLPTHQGTTASPPLQAGTHKMHRAVSFSYHSFGYVRNSLLLIVPPSYHYNKQRVDTTPMRYMYNTYTAPRPAICSFTLFIPTCAPHYCSSRPRPRCRRRHPPPPRRRLPAPHPRSCPIFLAACARTTAATCLEADYA